MEERKAHPAPGFKYGKGRYSLQLGWDGYYYQDMLEFRAD